MARVYKRLGFFILPREFDDLGLEDNPQYHPNEDKTQNNKSFPQLAEELESMPDVASQFIAGEILLPRGDQVVRGHIVVRGKDAKGNIMGRSHTNPVLDTRMYQVKY